MRTLTDAQGTPVVLICSSAKVRTINHPGPAEFARYGQVLVESVLG